MFRFCVFRSFLSGFEMLYYFSLTAPFLLRRSLSTRVVTFTVLSDSRADASHAKALGPAGREDSLATLEAVTVTAHQDQTPGKVRAAAWAGSRHPSLV